MEAVGVMNMRVMVLDIIMLDLFKCVLDGYNAYGLVLKRHPLRNYDGC